MYRTLFAGIAMFATHGAHAEETLRCGRWLVNSSATVEELLAKCGSPTSVREQEEDIRALGPKGGMIKMGTAVTHYWTYSRGSQAAALVVTIKNHKIHSIKRAES